MTIDQKQVPGKGTVFAYIVLFTAFAAVVVAKQAGILPSAESKRLIGIVLALMLAVTGNFLPKLLHPDRSNSATLRRQRRSGWGLVVTGLVLVAALLAAPADQIELWAGILGLGGLSWVLLDALFGRPSVRRDTPTREMSAPEKKHATARLNALFIVHAIGWVFAMFLGDYLWGDSSAKWMVVVFTISNGLLAVVHAGKFSTKARA